MNTVRNGARRRVMVMSGLRRRLKCAGDAETHPICTVTWWTASLTTPCLSLFSPYLSFSTCLPGGQLVALPHSLLCSGLPPLVPGTWPPSVKSSSVSSLSRTSRKSQRYRHTLHSYYLLVLNNRACLVDENDRLHKARQGAARHVGW